MALDLTPEQKEVGKQNFHRVVGKLGKEGVPDGMSRRQFMRGLIAAGVAAPVTAAAYYGYQNNFRERPVKAGLIGSGDEGGVLVGEHNPAYVEFIAYSDIRPSNQARIFLDERDRNPNSPRRGFNFHYGNDAHRKIRLYDDYRQLLANPEIEMVVIALPLHLHAAATIAALEAGKHVLCEKLMAWNIRQCKDMIRAAERANRLLSIGHQRHYSMLYAQANEVVSSGVLGEVQHIRALWHRNNAVEIEDASGQVRYRDSWNPAIKPEDRDALAGRIRTLGYRSMEELVRWRLYKRTGGGLMAELGSHQLDACSIFLGKQRPIAVTAVGGKHFYPDNREVEDHVYCIYEFPGNNYDRSRGPDATNNDIVIVTYSSINTNNFERYGECIMGSKGTLVVEEEQSAMLYGPAAAQRGTAMTVTTAGGRPALDASDSTGPAARRDADAGQSALGVAAPSRGYREEMEHLAYCIRNRDQGMASDRERLQPRCGGRQAMADAIVALTANAAMNDPHNKRIVFQNDWFDPTKEAVPPVNLQVETV
ncbi:MAG: Gfo/Idh/MocA family oxidoreductase [Gemmataceae bacterium]|nr:Gfo/Idh/MocA family oxidoreductase [Gemmataceae bacterium]